MSDWQKVTLGDFVGIKHGYAFKGNCFQSEPNGIILATPGNFVIGGGWKEEKCKYYNGDIPEEYKLSGGELVVTMTDLSKELDTLGYSAIIPSNSQNIYLHNQRIGLVEFIQDDIDKSYLYWLMRDKEYRWHIVSSASGSTVSHTSPTRIREYTFLLPPLSEQQAIAQVLSSLDDKIDLLHRQNKTLEAIAETLFRQWFIEDAQDDWEEKSLLDVIQVINGGTPKTSIPEYWNGDIPWLSGGDITSSHKSFVLSSVKTITQDGLDHSSAKLLPRFATVITARGTVGKYALLSKPIAYSQSNFGILPKIEGCFFFTYLLINHVVRELQSAAYGSVFDTITATTFKEIKITVPPAKKVEEFEKSVSPYFLKKLHCLAQVQTLEKLRDTLLPKLMSGEVRVDLQQ